MGLKHPCHEEHLLILRILSENCPKECRLCSLEIQGPTYCCEDCDYFLHGSCAVIELPPEIRHPYHPHQPLAISEGYYSCRECKHFQLDALVATATLPPRDDEDAEEGIILHFAHKVHPLVPFHVEIQLRHRCEGCTRRISGQVYGCRTCLFLLHASCARSPQVIDHHPFGTGLTLAQRHNSIGSDPECRGCAESIYDGLVYRRPDSPGGSFSLHMACALSMKFPRSHHELTNSTELEAHHLHPCPLVLLHIEEETYAPIYCRVCELKISGEREALSCPECGFFLHKSCAEKLPLEIRHYLHPDHSLKLKDELARRDKDYGRCASCGESVSKRGVVMAFQCDSCEFYLHPNCALQTLSAVEDGAPASVPHFAHDHPLQLHFTRNRSTCMACKKSIPDGLAYCCVTCEPIGLHRSCVEMPRELVHPFHSQHLLVLLSKASTGYFHCSVCRTKSNGYAYYCAECEFYLDVECATLNLILKHLRHEHSLAYFERSINDRLHCNACGKKCKNDFYCCLPCDFRLHRDCLPLLPEIIHECHVHPLSLKEEFVYGDPDYQYCDHCEELRNPGEGVYRCEDCGFSARIDCMISKDEVDTEAEAMGTKVEPEDIETVASPEADQANSKGEHLKAVAHVMRRNIDTMRGSLETLMKEVEELEMQRESLKARA